MNPKTRFKLFRERCANWGIEMAQADYLQLLDWISLFVDNELCENPASPFADEFPED